MRRVELKVQVLRKEDIESLIVEIENRVKNLESKKLTHFGQWCLDKDRKLLEDKKSILDEMNNRPLDEYILIGNKIVNGLTIDKLI